MNVFSIWALPVLGKHNGAHIRNIVVVIVLVASATITLLLTLLSLTNTKYRCPHTHTSCNVKRKLTNAHDGSRYINSLTVKKYDQYRILTFCAEKIITASKQTGKYA